MLPLVFLLFCTCSGQLSEQAMGTPFCVQMDAFSLLSGAALQIKGGSTTWVSSVSLELSPPGQAQRIYERPVRRLFGLTPPERKRNCERC